MYENLTDSFRKKLRHGAVFGSFMKTSDPAFVEIAGHAGMDFVVLDMEHGPVGLGDMQNNVRAAQLTGVMPIIRVAGLNEQLISQALDIGAAAVQIPQIYTSEQAERAVRYAKYHPEGERGVCRFVRAAGYSSAPREQYFEKANRDTLVIIQVEGSKAIDSVDEILAVEGVDIVFIGPYDLSQSFGVPGRTSHPKVVSAMEDIVKRAEKLGVVTGTFTDSPETLKTWMNAGVKYLSYSVDVGIFYEACAGLVQGFKSS